MGLIVFAAMCHEYMIASCIPRVPLETEDSRFSAKKYSGHIL